MTERLDRAGLELSLDERFTGPGLDETRWLPAYLPHWTQPGRAAARWSTGPDGLRLRIDPDQPPWSPEWTGALRVSALQSGSFGGPVGSGIGQHRFRPDLVVRSAAPGLEGFALRSGLVEMRARAIADPGAMVALWLIGTEDVPERSAELCVMELFAHDIGVRRARVGMGVHPFGDPTLRDDFEAVQVPVDARDAHEYAVAWGPEGTAWYIDGVLVRRSAQAPAYPMQVMLTVFDLPVHGVTAARSEPLTFHVAWVRGWRRAAAASGTSG